MDPDRTVHHPMLQMLGPIELLGATGTVPPRAAKQCLEYCALAAGKPRKPAPSHGGGACRGGGHSPFQHEPAAQLARHQPGWRGVFAGRLHRTDHACIQQLAPTGSGCRSSPRPGSTAPATTVCGPRWN